MGSTYDEEPRKNQRASGTNDSKQPDGINTTSNNRNNTKFVNKCSCEQLQFTNVFSTHNQVSISFNMLPCSIFCNMQCTRYYAHVSFLLNVPSGSDQDRDEYIEYVAQQLNRGGLFWSLGLRAFYFSFPLLLWIFGAIAMLACSIFMTILLYFLDSASSSPCYLQACHLNRRDSDTESSLGAGLSRNSDLRWPLLESNKPPSSYDNLFNYTK